MFWQLYLILYILQFISAKISFLNLIVSFSGYHTGNDGYGFQVQHFKSRLAEQGNPTSARLIKYLREQGSVRCFIFEKNGNRVATLPTPACFLARATRVYFMYFAVPYVYTHVLRSRNKACLR